MHSVAFLPLVVSLVAYACADPGTNSAKCVRRTTEDVIAFQHVMMKVVMNGEIIKRGLVPQKEAVLKLAEETFQEVAAASRAMATSTSMNDVAVNRARVLKILENRVPDWRAKIENILEKIPDEPETRESKTEEMTHFVLSVADSKLLRGIERSVEGCF